MRLKKLSLENFRSYKKLEFSFNEGKNITAFSGPNASGKTNILEAIFMLAASKSLRTENSSSLIKWGEDYFRIKGEAEKNGENASFEIFFSAKPEKIKQVKINGLKKKSSDFIGNFFAVLFSPDDLNLVFLSPHLRRRYLDIVLSQVKKNYCKELINYQKIIKNRNKILIRLKEKKGKSDELDFWDKELISFALPILKKRREFIDFLNEHLEANLNKISGKKHRAEVAYINSVKDPDNFLLLLKENLEKDVFLSSTGIGPHRDDIKFFIDGKDAKEFASRGEIRSLILALKITEIKFFKTLTGLKPVLLLDDVFSELDKTRQKLLLKAVEDEQVILTTTIKDCLKGISPSAPLRANGERGRIISKIEIVEMPIS